MREKGPFVFLGVIFMVTIWFFSMGADRFASGDHSSATKPLPSIVINGRAYLPTHVDRDEEGRMVVIIDRDDLFEGENTVELRWTDVSSSMIAAEDLPEAETGSPKTIVQ
ncbi:MAG: hypothetical protein OEU86_10130 [Gammaproteobacteria bacterium]|nr:hypothetical protein [Gammaproteobacteria bacterium]